MSTTSAAPKKGQQKKEPQMKAVKAESKKPATKKKETPVVNISDRIQQARNQASLVKKWEDLQEYRKDLDSFKFGGDDNRQELEISDGEYHFRTTKTEHCEIVVAELIKLVDAKIEETEAKIAA